MTSMFVCDIISSLWLEAVTENTVPKFIQKYRMKVGSAQGAWDVMQVATKQKSLNVVAFLQHGRSTCEASKVFGIS
jgi:hypothetical protein